VALKSRITNNKAGNRIQSSNKNPYGAPGPLTRDDVKISPHVEQISIEPGEVVDIILTPDHKYYDSDNPNGEEQFGMCRVRLINSNKDQGNEELLEWAFPLHRNIKQYPVKHEIVLVHQYVTREASVAEEGESTGTMDRRLYYSGILNLWGSIHHNALPFLSIAEPSILEEDSDLAAKYKETGFGNPNIEGDDGGIEFGDTFKEQAKIRPIQPYEGDLTLEGRFGHSIRFGSAVKPTEGQENTWSDPSTDDPAEPILIIRNGQDQDLPAGGEHIVENPDVEAASIWMTKGQTVPLTFGSTKYDALSFEAGENTVGSDLTSPTTDNLIDDVGERQGQIILTANRLVFNSREAGVFIFGGGPGIGLTTENDMTFDAGSEFLVDTPSIYLNATEKLEIEAPLIYLGKSQQSEDDGGVGETQATKGHPLVLGDEDDLWKSTLCNIIDAMLTTLQGEIHPTPVGPSGPPIQAPQYAQQQADIATLKASLATSYSDTVWVQRNG